eukprot:g2130.t1
MAEAPSFMPSFGSGHGFVCTNCESLRQRHEAQIHRMMRRYEEELGKNMESSKRAGDRLKEKEEECKWLRAQLRTAKKAVHDTVDEVDELSESFLDAKERLSTEYGREKSRLEMELVAAHKIIEKLQYQNSRVFESLKEVATEAREQREKAHIATDQLHEMRSRLAISTYALSSSS